VWNRPPQPLLERPAQDNAGLRELFSRPEPM